MNFDELKVVFRTNDKFISARLELECQRAFAVIFENELKDPKDVIVKERMELDVRFLQKINESEYLYKQLVELPGSSRAGRVMLNR
jgi:ethanolamine utilization cobalamin adenosyltransferase